MNMITKNMRGYYLSQTLNNHEEDNLILNHRDDIYSQALYMILYQS